MINKLQWFSKFELKKKVSAIKVSVKPKIFGIGAIKTGTTSLAAALREMGFLVAPQRPAEKLIFDWAKRDFTKLIEFCKYSGDAFQDMPFSLPYTYVVLDQYFPKSKFILTVRDNPEQWYNSITKFHAKIWGKNNRIPTKEDLKKGYYIYKGHAWKSIKLVFNTPDNNPYQKDLLLRFYKDHNKSVIEYFRYRKSDLLVLNVAEEGAYQKLAKFLNIKTKKTKFPWEQKTEDLYE